MSTVVESLLVALGFQADTSGANQFMGSMDGLIGKITAAAGIIGGIFAANGFIETASQFEQFETQLETIQGSSEKAKESMAWIADFAAKTPYEMQQVTDAFVKLQSYGLDARNGGLLESVGNMASGMGKGLDQAVEAIADAVNGENERLKEFGIKASKKGEMFTYTYNMDGKQFQVQAKNEAADIQEALQGIMDARFKGGMEKMSKTWTGILSNLSDTWDMLKLRLMSAGVFDALKDRLNGLMTAIQDNKDAIFEWAESAGQSITQFINIVSDGIGSVIDFVQETGLAEPILKLLGATAIYTGFALLGMATGGLIRATIGMTRFAIASLAAAWPLALIGAAIAGLILLIDDYLNYKAGNDSIIGRLVESHPGLLKVIQTFESMGGYISVLIDYAKEFWQQIKMVFDSIYDTGTAGNYLKDTFGFAFEKIGEAITALMPVIGVLIFAIGFIVKGWILLTAAAAGFIAIAITGLVGVVAYIVGAVSNAIQGIINFFLVDIPNAITSFVETSKSMFQSFVDSVTGIIPDWLKNLFTGGNSSINVNVNGNIPPVTGAVATGAANAGRGGNTATTTVHQNVNVTVPTGAAAGAATREMGSSAAKNAASNSKKAVHQ